MSGQGYIPTHRCTTNTGDPDQGVAVQVLILQSGECIQKKRNISSTHKYELYPASSVQQKTRANTRIIHARESKHGYLSKRHSSPCLILWFALVWRLQVYLHKTYQQTVSAQDTKCSTHQPEGGQSLPMLTPHHYSLFTELSTFFNWQPRAAVTPLQ